MGAALTWVRYKAVRAEGAGGSRARAFGGGLRHGGGGSGFRIRLTTGPPERIAVGEEVEDGGERRAGAAGGEGGMCTARWQGVVRETSPMPGRQQPRCHRRGEAPARCSHELQGHSPSG